jgi:uncharacterized protein (TIGR03663 family)
MDNRRFSARAEIGASVPGRRNVSSANAVNPVLDRAIELTRLNWEVLIFAGLMVLTILTRLWDLGPRALHHDESIHAYFSNYFLKSGDYSTDLTGQALAPGQFNSGGGYDPTYHGPFLYHIVALGFFLFGTTDATARIMPAFFGIVLVGLCWFLRPFIGRVGAMIAALLIILSPVISYYSRSLRHDIFALTGTMLLFISLLWFMRTHQSRWVYLGALGFTIAFASHELVFIIAFIFTLFLALAAFLYPMFAGNSNYSGRYAREGDDVNPVRSALASLVSQRWTLLGAALLFLVIYGVLFTNTLTKPHLFTSGFFEGLAYWTGQHGEARGNQPVFYYLLMMPFYEGLALFAGIGTVIYMIVKLISRSDDYDRPGDNVDTGEYTPTDEYGHVLPRIDGLRGLTLSFLAFWSFGALIAFSLAGERMPWLLMQPALPFTLLASAGIGRMLLGIEWQQVRKGGGLILGIAVVLFIFSAFSMMAHFNNTMPAPIGESAGFQSALRGILLVLFTLVLLALCGWLAYKMMPSRAVKVLGLTFAVLLAAYGLRSMMLLNYRHGDVPTEMLVYTQSSPDAPIVANMIQRLSRDETAFDQTRSSTDVTGGRGLTIAIDQNDAIEWPLDWYFRDMRDLKYFNYFDASGNEKPDKTNLIPPNAPVILTSERTENTEAFRNFIKDKYTTNKYVLNWWFPEEAYKKDGQGDLGTAMTWLGNNWTRYLLYRDPGLPLGSRNFYLHVRNDLAYKVGLAAPPAAVPIIPPGDTQPAGDTGKEYNMIDLAPVGIDKGQFNMPRGIAVDSDGSFYVVDTFNLRVQKFDKDGKFIRIIGGRGTGNGQFMPFVGESGDATATGPGGVAVDKAGNVYVADTWNHRIQKFDRDGKFLLKWGEFINLSDPAAPNDAARDTKFFGPRGVALDQAGNVYVTDTGNRRVVVFDSNGKYLRQMSSGLSPTRKPDNYAFNQPGEMNEPIGITVDPAGNVYVADTNNRRIQKFNAQGTFVSQIAVGNAWGDPGTYLLEPFLTTDAQGNLYATAPSSQKVIKYSPTGQQIAEKNSAGAVTLKTPTGITITPDGTVYVVDTGANGVVKLGPIQ